MNTLFIRLEGPLQSWRLEEKFKYRKTQRFPTKSGVVGLVSAQLGIFRDSINVKDELIALNSLKMGVREDRGGKIVDDYQTVKGSRAATGGFPDEGKEKNTTETVKEYLADASFLACLQGNPELIERVKKAFENPKFFGYLGSKCCSPSKPFLEGIGEYSTLVDALTIHPWKGRDEKEICPELLPALIESKDGKIVNDVTISFNPLVHVSRRVSEVNITPMHQPFVCVSSKSSYKNKPSESARNKRFEHDFYMCVVCQSPAEDAHHVDYTRYGDELNEDLRSVCKVCHDIITNIEYHIDAPSNKRLDPLHPKWQAVILARRKQLFSKR